MAEIYRVPAPGFDPRGIDIDTNGVVWTALAASSHLASFDRRKCKPITGPRKTDGSECPEGWALYQTNGPKLRGTDVPADFHYYNWVDQHDIAGLGPNTPRVPWTIVVAAPVEATAVPNGISAPMKTSDRRSMA